jgi:hypothetical protein
MKSIAILGLALTGSALSRTLATERPQQLRDIHLDDADNQLHSYFSMPNNQGNIQFNDHTVQRDAVDNELYRRTPLIIQQGIELTDYTVLRDTADNELRVPVRIPTSAEKANQTLKVQNDDETDNELHNYYSMDDNLGNIQFNDYTVHRDAADDELLIHYPYDQNKFLFARSQNRPVIMNDDEADNELHNYYSMDDNQGNIQFNDHTVHRDAADDEFVLTAAPTAASQKLTKDEIHTLASILKQATQDKDGNVMVDGVKVGKMPKQEAKKVEVPKTKKFLGN